MIIIVIKQIINNNLYKINNNLSKLKNIEDANIIEINNNNLYKIKLMKLFSQKQVIRILIKILVNNLMI